MILPEPTDKGKRKNYYSHKEHGGDNTQDLNSSFCLLLNMTKQNIKAGKMTYLETSPTNLQCASTVGG